MRLLPTRLNNKPQYVFHPIRAVRRAVRRSATVSIAPGVSPVLARLPWGLSLEVYESDAIGFSILTGGVFDPCVTETLHRLVDPGETVIDAGANVGYLTSLAAVRAGSGGAVLAFEPHPVVFSLLSANVNRWRGRTDTASVQLHQLALSDHEGVGQLDPGPVFHLNMGLSTLRDADAADAARDGAGQGETIDVPLRRLDEIVGDRAVGVMKLDVEGHEAGVLRGAGRLLTKGRIRDIVFEDQNPYPSEATECVEAAGYHLVSLDNDLFGLRMSAPADRGETSGWPGPSYLATRDRQRALARLRPRGWHVAGIAPSLPSRRRS
ncbi:MAG: FkbM family methyltransferase [Solirubrobacteraceae bacterium]